LLPRSQGIASGIERKLALAKLFPRMIDRVALRQLAVGGSNFWVAKASGQKVIQVLAN
jgi:hypothetical protein